MQEATTAERPSRTGGFLVLLGGVLVLVSSFIDWGQPRATGAGLDIQIQVRGGSIALIAGILLILAGLVLLLVASRGLRITAAVLSLLVGLGMLFFSLVFVAGDSGFRSAWASGCVDNNVCTNITTDNLKKELDKAIESGEVDFAPNKQIGLYLALAGGAISLVGGILGFKRNKAATAPATTWPGQQPGYAPVGGPPPAAPPASSPAVPPAAPPAGAPPAVPPAGPPAGAPPAVPPAGPPASPPAAPPAAPPPSAPPSAPPAVPPAAPPASPPPPPEGGGYAQ